MFNRFCINFLLCFVLVMPGAAASPVFAQGNTTTSATGGQGNATTPTTGAQGKTTTPAANSSGDTTTRDPYRWTPADVIALTTGILTGITGLIAALFAGFKAQAAQNTANVAQKTAQDANSAAATAQSTAQNANTAAVGAQSTAAAQGASLDRISNRLNEHSESITRIAQNQPPPR